MQEGQEHCSRLWWSEEGGAGRAGRGKGETDADRTEHWGLLTEIKSWNDPSAQVSFAEGTRNSGTTLP